ncbi:antibiotic biosynthesis monooxygenase [Klebsiella oxytoca]|uniref:Antibiotic biosynthesis monooxygenase n=1 Tax=Klebsiella oxytoca TaxID=571 RepID=A0AAD3ULJ8_KLEOX|nr:antibiotic biosynthesis monooxygenase [Klebsiella oxytoca]AYZ52766.1 antibiotic biosynthesis monooxygenase [Klebsiella oxytoca]EGT3582997.1 antibiotic biosynthesis monooxygenase [Klebsiella oxytoca]MBF8465579.1 antibiotic biosynthesis monooxygenase [Klebsiella oxytoca]MBX4506313.1 antibiotic biosynthesis monooxygenase [Klebsiella oxytoca]
MNIVEKRQVLCQMRFSSHNPRQVKKIMERCFNIIDHKSGPAHTRVNIDLISGHHYV